MAASIPRALERYALGARLDGPHDRQRAVDRDRGADVVVSRIAFGAARTEERDALVERARSLFAVSAPALIAVRDAGPWDDDAFVVEEAVVEPRSPAEALGDLDRREQALAARALAEGVARLHEAGWCIAALDASDVSIDAYRQPHLAIATRTVPRSEDGCRADVERLRAMVSSWARIGDASTAADLARAIEVPEATATPLLTHATPPRGASWTRIVIAIAVAIMLVLYFLSRR
jgi:hypothetical protein